MPGTRRDRHDRVTDVRRVPSSGHAAFFARVFAVEARIPHGRVTTYGTIARTLGVPRSARVVSWDMNLGPGEADLPCHRVVNRNSLLRGAWHGHSDFMASRLRDQDVPFLDHYHVDHAACLWDPSQEVDSESRWHAGHVPEAQP